MFLQWMYCHAVADIVVERIENCLVFIFRQNDRLHSSPAEAASYIIYATKNCFKQHVTVMCVVYRYTFIRGKRGIGKIYIYCKYTFFQMTVLHIFHYVFFLLWMCIVYISRLNGSNSKHSQTLRLMYFNNIITQCVHIYPPERWI